MFKVSSHLISSPSAPWCASALSSFAVFSRQWKKVSNTRQLRDLSQPRSFWPSHLTADLSAPTHTLTRGECHSTPSTSSSLLLTPLLTLLLPPCLTRLRMPVAPSHGGDNSHRPVSVFVPTNTHSCQHRTQSNYSKQLFFLCVTQLFPHSYFILLCLCDKLWLEDNRWPFLIENSCSKSLTFSYY